VGNQRQGGSRRRFVQAALAAGATIPGGVAGLIGAALAQSDAAQGMRKLRGEVLVNGQPANKRTVVRPGDTVTTEAKSFATFVIGQDAFLVRGDSRLELSGSGGLANVLRLVTGKLLSVYSKGRPREIAGVTATIGIRGTGAYMETAPDRTYFCTPAARAHARRRGRHRLRGA